MEEPSPKININVQLGSDSQLPNHQMLAAAIITNYSGSAEVDKDQYRSPK
jgi:hypothetical protein